MDFINSEKNKNLNLLSHLHSFHQPTARITGIGSCVPDQIVDNAMIAQNLTAPERLKKNLPNLIDRTTMVKTRRYAPRDCTPTDLGTPAVLQALQTAGRAPEDIDTLIFASTDTDQLEPASANILQKKLGIKRVNAFDISNACNSFLQAVNVANSLIASGSARCVAICSAELGSHWVSQELKDKDELRYKIGALTLGDAAAAVILEPATDTCGISEINLFSLGEYWELCHVPEDPLWRKKPQRNIHGWFYLDMAGLAKVVRPLTIQYFMQYRDYRKTEHGEEDFKKNLAQVIPHQISRRLISEITQSLKADPALVAITADDYGNTAAAAIPFTLHQAIQDGTLQLGSGQEVLLFGTASGLGMGHIRLKI